MPGHLDNEVEGAGMRLSEFYHKNRELFDCPADDMPVMVCMAHSSGYLSVQLHPGDEYGLAHDGMRGRPEGWVVLTGPETIRIQLGHKAKTREEFIELAQKKDWDRLLRYVDMKPGQYVHVPAGTLHAFCKDAIAAAFSVNGDITYRLYDYDRIDENTGKPRQLHLQQVFDNITVPDNEIDCFDPVSEVKNGCRITYFLDEPKVYTSGRIQVNGTGTYHTDRFMFFTCAAGSGKINGVDIKGGETLFVPANFGALTITGDVDLMYVTYRNE